MKVHLSILFLFSVYRISEGKIGFNKALVYLSQYGYLDPNSMGNSSQLDEQTFRQSLLNFQAFAGIPETGKLDYATKAVMSLPRCGIKDNIALVNRSQNFVVQGSKWRSTHLTFKITKYPRRLNRQSVDVTIQNAFRIWSKYTPLTFEPTTGRANINIRFELGAHGDGDSFDGPGGTLAHAYFPQYGGATHFDDSEPWVIGGGQGTDLLQVATHEFGHALGLSHSTITEALMAPYYKSNLRNVDLFSDDIAGIQKIYGQRNGAPPNPRNPARPGNPFPGPRWLPRYPGRPYFPAFPRNPGFPRFPRFPSFPRFPRFPRFPMFPSFPRFPRYHRNYNYNYGF